MAPTRNSLNYPVDLLDSAVLLAEARITALANLYSLNSNYYDPLILFLIR